MINFKSIPFFKIILPYILGIVCVLNFGLFKQQHHCFGIICLLLIIAFLFQKYYKPVFYFKKSLFIFCVNLFLFLAAFETSFLYNAKNDRDHYLHYLDQAEQGFIGIINDVPVITEKYTKLSICVKNIEHTDQWHFATGNAIVYLKNDSYTHFAIGNTVLIRSKFSYVNEPKNPYEFDYKTYLSNKNIFQVVYAKSDQVFLIPAISNDFSLSQLGANIKAKTISVLRESGLSQQAFAISSALLVGYDDEIDSDVMQSFSHSGTLHVLSVSGMHTGVLYGILVFLFSLFDKHDQYKKWKCFFVILCLVLFVFITGFSPSVLRAALMLILVLLGKTFYRQGNSYNTLLLSAFLLLLMNPYLLLDVGFLLSYFAVFGIMYLYPVLNNLYYFENKLIRWFWSMTLMSVAATVFTLPISLYYFHQFPIWFVFSNLIIIPLSTVLMLAAVVLICCYKILLVKQFLVWIINGVNSIMLWFAQLTDNEDYGYLDYISFSKIDLFFCSLFIFLVLIILHAKQYRHVLWLGFTCIIWVTCSIVVNYQETQQKELVVFHVKQKSVYALRIGQTLYVNFDSLNENELQRQVRPYLLSFNVAKVVKANNNLINGSFGSVLHINETNDGFDGLSPNYVIISNNASVDLPTYNDKIKPLIIADCSNSYTFVKKLKKQCALLDLDFYSVKESGALQLKLDNEVTNRR